MRYSPYILFAITLPILSFALGCTNAIPQSTISSGLNLAAPAVTAPASSNEQLISTYNSSITLSGTCTTLTTQLQVSYNGGGNWNNLPSTCPTNGQFVMPIANASALGIAGGFVATSPAGATETFQLRSTTPLGNTSATVITLELPPTYNSNLADIRSGAKTMAGTHYTITGKFGSAISKPSLAGTNYNIQLENQ